MEESKSITGPCYRHALTEAQRKRIEHLLPGKEEDPGVTAQDNRLAVDGVLWILKIGAPWRDLPERYGKWNSVYQRFNRLAKAGIWQLDWTLTPGEAADINEAQWLIEDKAFHSLIGDKAYDADALIEWIE